MGMFFASTPQSQSFIHQVRILSVKTVPLLHFGVEVAILYSSSQNSLSSRRRERIRLSVKSHVAILYSSSQNSLVGNRYHSLNVSSIERQSQSFIHQVRILSLRIVWDKRFHDKPLSQSFIHQVRILSSLGLEDNKKEVKEGEEVAILYSSSQNSLRLFYPYKPTWRVAVVAILYSSSQNSLVFLFTPHGCYDMTGASQSFIHQVRILSCTGVRKSFFMPRP